MRSPAFLRRAYAVLARLSPSYPPLRGTFRCITHPFATDWSCPQPVRLACVKHAASVQSEPGSNSSLEKLDLLQELNRRWTHLPQSLREDKTYCRVSTSVSVHPPTSTSFPPPRGSGKSSSTPGHQTAAPTPIGCQFLKSRPRRGAFVWPCRSEDRDYTHTSTFRST